MKLRDSLLAGAVALSGCGGANIVARDACMRSINDMREAVRKLALSAKIAAIYGLTSQSQADVTNSLDLVYSAEKVTRKRCPREMKSDADVLSAVEQIKADTIQLNREIDAINQSKARVPRTPGGQ